MTILQMKCFISLATTKKLTETANIFGLGASTLSKYIDHMEDELSVKLFRRNQNRLEITKEGEIIYPSIQFMVKRYNDMVIHMSGFTHQNRTTVNVALIFHQTKILMNLTNFSKIHPDINLIVMENASSVIETLLDTANTDIAIIYEELLEKKYPHTYPIRKDKLVAIVSKDHPLASRECISVSELKNETFYLFKGDMLMYRYQLHTCIAAGFAPTESHNNLRVKTILDCVAANRGVSLLIDNTVNCLKNKNVIMLPLVEDPTLTISAFIPAAYLTDISEKLVTYLNNTIDMV
jgi:DNA-binding transcriptional LysR family regulator